MVRLTALTLTLKEPLTLYTDPVEHFGLNRNLVDHITELPEERTETNQPHFTTQINKSKPFPVLLTLS